jgi:hypothetical protein
MPFTSTALIARNMGKPSIYYDPTGNLQKDDRAAHGIPIVSGVSELETWLSTQLAYSEAVIHAIGPFPPGIEAGGVSAEDARCCAG